MKEVIVHIGFHKTGTSSIQDSLANYDDGQTIYARFGPSNHSIPITTIFSDKRYDYHIWKNQNASAERVEAARDHYRTILDAHLADETRERLIISGEDIGILTDSEKEALCAYLRAKNVAFKIVCFVRGPRSGMASAVQQLVRGGLIAIDPIALGYRSRLEWFANALPVSDLLVHDFDASVRTYGDIVHAFSAICKIDTSIISIVRSNESLSLQAVRLLYRFNNLPINSFGTPERSRARLKFIDLLDGLFPVVDHRSKLEEQMASGLALFDEAEISFLRSRFGIDYDMPYQGNGSAAFDAYLRDVSDINADALRSALVQRGIAVHPSDTIDNLLSDAFYAGLYPGSLTDDDAPPLRDMALKIEKGEDLSMHDAVALMSLAARARPGGPSIRQKLEEWQSLGNSA